jgi:hypothetical protein
MEKPLISFDYAIKYLLKDKGDYEIVEGFISALLTSEGYKPVKIKALLDGESNKESRYLGIMTSRGQIRHASAFFLSFCLLIPQIISRFSIRISTIIRYTFA